MNWWKSYWTTERKRRWLPVKITAIIVLGFIGFEVWVRMMTAADTILNYAGMAALCLIVVAAVMNLINRKQ